MFMGKKKERKKAPKEAKSQKKEKKEKKPYSYTPRKSCPKCGPGVNLAEHKNRNSCGKCGYFERK